MSNLLPGERRAVLLPASAETMRRPGVRLPVLPDWAPLDPKPTEDDPTPRVWGPEERAQRRVILARYLASEGPYDGQRVYVNMRNDQPPLEIIPPNAPNCRYVFDGEDPATGVLRYRYDPTCRMHPALVQCVEEAYLDADPQYAAVARADNTSAPGYTTRPQEA